MLNSQSRVCPPVIPSSPHSHRAIRRTGRVSLVVLALATVMIIGIGAVGGFGVTIILAAIKAGDMGLTPLC